MLNAYNEHRGLLDQYMCAHRTVFHGVVLHRGLKENISSMSNDILALCHFFEGRANNVNRMYSDLLAPCPSPSPRVQRSMASGNLRVFLLKVAMASPMRAPGRGRLPL